MDCERIFSHQLFGDLTRELWLKTARHINFGQFLLFKLSLLSELARFSGLYEKHAPEMLAGKYLRLAIYARHAGDPRAWSFFRRGASLHAPMETLGGLVMMIAPSTSALLVRGSKLVGLVKRHG